MMNTPICDFVRSYSASSALRLHMPGHKGVPLLGFEAFDITEIDGADSLYHASGIIKESEKNASYLFGSDTYYSTEGSSQCIKAMLHLAVMYAEKQGKRAHIAAGRNAHKAFLNAAALLNFDISWLTPKESDSYLSLRLSAQDIKNCLGENKDGITAVYITSPDYLGNITELGKIARVCHENNVLLLVDNAHGAYLKFLRKSLHPIDLGADICCDSAHKTLPVLTGGAYLHIGKEFSDKLSANVKSILQTYGSTSPSYLILQSLDMANKYIAEGYPKKLCKFIEEIRSLREELTKKGYSLCGDEPLKLTVSAKKYGYTGKELAEILYRQNIVCEFCDPDFLVLMLTPEIGTEGLVKLKNCLFSIRQKEEICEAPPSFEKSIKAMDIRAVSFKERELLPTQKCVGRVLASPSVGCPPAVPILICGEQIDQKAIDRFKYYGIEMLEVVKE